MNNLPSLRDLSRQTLAAALAATPSDAPLFAVDATMGNGHDTVFLARATAMHPGGGRIHAFDVQAKALERTGQRLTAEGLLPFVDLHLAGHETAADTLRACHARPNAPAAPFLRAVMFNLGFLPAANRTLTTRAPSTLAAARALLELLTPGGLMSLHMYEGHPHGAEEADAVRSLAAELPCEVWETALYHMPNKARNPECLALILRRHC